MKKILIAAFLTGILTMPALGFEMLKMKIPHLPEGFSTPRYGRNAPETKKRGGKRRARNKRSGNKCMGKYRHHEYAIMCRHGCYSLNDEKCDCHFRCQRCGHRIELR